MKACPRCHRAKPREDYSPRPRSRDGLASWCKECTNEATRSQRNSFTAARTRARELREKYGITLAAYEAMLAEQGGGCAICGRTSSPKVTSLAVDHDHDTGKIRGVLCRPCNSALGMLGDDPAIVARALAYLTLHKQTAADHPEVTDGRLF